MCKDNPSIPSILQNLWDEVLKDSNIMLVLCGSAMNFIEKELLAEKNPLFGRAKGIYKMGAMHFYDAARFFPLLVCVCFYELFGAGIRRRGRRM